MHFYVLNRKEDGASWSFKQVIAQSVMCLAHSDLNCIRLVYWLFMELNNKEKILNPPEGRK